MILMSISNEDALSLVSLWLLNPLNFVLDHFHIDSAIASFNATMHQLVTICRSICAEERAEILDPLMGSMYSCGTFFSSRSFPLFIVFVFFTELDSVLCQMGQGAAPSGPRCFDTSDTSGDESEASPHRRRV